MLALKVNSGTAELLFSPTRNAIKEGKPDTGRKPIGRA
jgi:hypothetical protein